MAHSAGISRSAQRSEGRLDLVVFFWDLLEPQPHDVDVKALLRIAVVYNTPIACNRSTADFLLSSPLLDEPYERFATAPELPHAVTPPTLHPTGRTADDS